MQAFFVEMEKLLDVDDLDLHLYALFRVIVGVARLIDDLVGNIHAFYDLSECGVLAIKKRRVSHADEKLRTCAVRVTCTGHREHAALVRRSIELGLDGVAGAAHAVLRLVGILGIRVAALDHEARNDAVKGRPVVKAFLCEINEVLHMARCDIRKELQFDIAELGGDNGTFFRHLFRLLLSGLWLRFLLRACDYGTKHNAEADTERF